MVAGRYRSRTFRRKAVKTPGGKVKRVYVLKRPRQARCTNCAAQLQGVPRLRPGRLAKVPRSRRRPERPYGGVLCSSCAREVFKSRVRNA